MLENMKVVRDKEGDHNHKSEHVGLLTKISKKRKIEKESRVIHVMPISIMKPQPPLPKAKKTQG